MRLEVGPRSLFPQTGLRLTGRGRYPSMAQAGGTEPARLPQALANVAQWGGKKYRHNALCPHPDGWGGQRPQTVSGMNHLKIHFKQGTLIAI